MKYIYITILSFVVFSLTSCDKDNYDSPNSTLRGAILYKGDTLRLKNAEISLLLYEGGWANPSEMAVKVSQNGSFAAEIFSGKEYKLVPSALGPWEVPGESDEIHFTSNKNVNLNIEVKPYFMLRNTEISISNQNEVTANFDIERISQTAHVEYARLILFPNKILDASNDAVDKENSPADISGTNLNDNGANTIHKTIVEASLLKYNFIYARVAIKVVGSSGLLYSVPVKVQLNK